MGALSQCSDRYKNYKLNFNDLTKQEYYDKYFKKNKEDQCIVCGKISIFLSLDKGYSNFCSFKCKCSYAGKISSQKNPNKWKEMVKASIKVLKDKTYEEIYGIDIAKIKRKNLSLGQKKFFRSKKGKKRITQMKIEQSLIMKEKILKGEFTPKTNNRLTHLGKYFIFINNKKIELRSSWELKLCNFLIKNNIKDFGYETTRIKYFDSIKKTERIYIVDFFIKNLNLLIEIKPKSIAKKQNFKDKFKWVKKYAKNNKLRFILLTEKDLNNEFKILEDIIYVKSS